MIYTWSKFNYGHTIDDTNPYIPFSEGVGPEIIAEIENGNYTLGDFAAAVEDALNAAGDLTYTVSVNRGSNIITISASGSFKLRTHSGTATATAFELMGFNYPGADLTGSSSYTGNAPSGSEYRPQFLLQSYVPPTDIVESVQASINESADGRVEIIRFGTRNKIEMDIKFITNLTMDGTTIRNNPGGVEDARAFLGYITQKKRFEFVPDVTAPSTFYKVLLEKTPDYNDGTGFRLRELFTNDLPDFYETGVIQLRVVT